MVISFVFVIFISFFNLYIVLIIQLQLNRIEHSCFTLPRPNQCTLYSCCMANSMVVFCKWDCSRCFWSCRRSAADRRRNSTSAAFTERPGVREKQHIQGSYLPLRVLSQFPSSRNQIRAAWSPHPASGDRSALSCSYITLRMDSPMPARPEKDPDIISLRSIQSAIKHHGRTISGGTLPLLLNMLCLFFCPTDHDIVTTHTFSPRFPKENGRKHDMWPWSHKGPFFEIEIYTSSESWINSFPLMYGLLGYS